MLPQIANENNISVKTVLGHTNGFKKVNGRLLVSVVVILSFLGLYYSGEKRIQRAKNSPYSKPVAIAFDINRYRSA